LREHRLAAKWGDDVLALYDTLYHAYSALPALQKTANLHQRILCTPIAPNAETPYHALNLNAHKNPSLEDGAMVIHDSAVILNDSSMVFDDFPLAVDDSTLIVDSATTVGDSAMTIDPVLFTPDSKRQRKLLLRRINVKKRRQDAMQGARRTEPDGDFKFLCPLCPEVCYFDRSGLLGHL
jgi:hypothetical protein